MANESVRDSSLHQDPLRSSPTQSYAAIVFSGSDVGHSISGKLVAQNRSLISDLFSLVIDQD